ncbi:hypothetical protein C8R43DRAFT_958070 [Mycena crocata]|nr:hypothetical protein C8R43DRAFT_958070 [Mycena crocata]
MSSNNSTPAGPSMKRRASRRSPSPFSPPPEITPQERRRRHADAQCRYRERNLEVTRQKARQWMEMLRFRRSDEDTALAAERRRIVDADYRERCRKRGRGPLGEAETGCGKSPKKQRTPKA